MHPKPPCYKTGVLHYKLHALNCDHNKAVGDSKTKFTSHSGLEDADLEEADFEEADLEEADLEEEDLEKADLAKEDLEEANLE